MIYAATDAYCLALRFIAVKFSIIKCSKRTLSIITHDHALAYKQGVEERGIFQTLQIFNSIFQKKKE